MKPAIIQKYSLELIMFITNGWRRRKQSIASSYSTRRYAQHYRAAYVVCGDNPITLHVGDKPQFTHFIHSKNAVCWPLQTVQIMAAVRCCS